MYTAAVLRLSHAFAVGRRSSNVFATSGGNGGPSIPEDDAECCTPLSESCETGSALELEESTAGNGGGSVLTIADHLCRQYLDPMYSISIYLQ